MDNLRLKGKTVASTERKTWGHYDYIVYEITFTDGTKVHFRGTSGADVEVTLTKPVKKREKK